MVLAAVCVHNESTYSLTSVDFEVCVMLISFVGVYFGTKQAVRARSHVLVVFVCGHTWDAISSFSVRPDKLTIL